MDARSHSRGLQLAACRVVFNAQQAKLIKTASPAWE
jgi:hypothetical protein